MEKSMFKIEKDVPIPAEYTRKKYPLGDLKIGDSFLIPKDKAPTNMSASLAPQVARLSIKITIRKQPNGDYRVWRIE
jgi:hypothetical protein